MNKLIIIAAVGKNGELGLNNNLIWRIKGDMKFFKEHTMGHHVFMGKNTFNSLPKILPGRTHVVLSKSLEQKNLPKEVILVRSLDEFYNCMKNVDDDVYVIGGAKVYSEMINNADMMYLTEIDSESLDADAYFPNFKDEDWQKQILEEHLESTPAYKHVLYKKRKKVY